ncbi:VWA domain-containing protein [Candidatus Woesearchaeota archaeon]|nr:VWA domain-containing protein [Candidatus Woesearchaeota archaeon]
MTEILPNKPQIGNPGEGLEEELLSQDRADMSIEKGEEGEEVDGHLANSMDDKDRLANSVMEVDTDNIDDGVVVEEAFNQNIGSFLPDVMFKELVKDYKNAKKLYGETLIRELSGYDPRFIDKNAKIPEFQRELQKKLKDKADELKNKGMIGASGKFSPDALNTAALFLIREEFEHTNTGYSQLGEPVHKARDQTGERSTIRDFKKHDPYRDIAVRQSVAKAIRRGHKELIVDDLKSFDREARQKVNIVYALDTSGSMKGEKLRLAKRSGVALGHRAIRDNNKVGLVIFGSDIEKSVGLTKDFMSFVKPLALSTPGQETDIALAVRQGVRLLENETGIKHIVLITDGLHTTSNNPEGAVLDEIGKAIAQDITISVVGIALDKLGEKMATTIVDHSKGKLYAVSSPDEVQGVVIADYRSLL